MSANKTNGASMVRQFEFSIRIQINLWFGIVLFICSQTMLSGSAFQTITMEMENIRKWQICARLSVAYGLSDEKYRFMITQVFPIIFTRYKLLLDNLIMLRDVMKTLYHYGFSWPHPFTQCILKQQLKLIRDNMPVDISVCDVYARIPNNRIVSLFRIDLFDCFWLVLNYWCLIEE